MLFERWGSLSVDDHIDTAALVANVLLYDRLVVPVMTEQVDQDEPAYWVSKGWNPDLQSERLKQLGQLAIKRPWNAARREIFRSRAQQLHAERDDASAKQATRMILAQEQVLDNPPGVQGVTVVAAYNSMTSVEQDFHVSDTKSHLAAQAYLLSRRLAVPDLANPEDSLKAAIELSREPEFQVKRSDLFEWQELAAAKGWKPEDTVPRISEMVDKYNEKVQVATGKVRWKFAFTIFGAGLGFVFGGPVGAVAGTALSLIQFATLDRKPAIEVGNLQPVAMFHDIETRLGIPLL
jgi:hypothetical protein